MQFEWDEQKNRENIRRRGLDFSDAWRLFDEPMLTALDTTEGYGEDRFVGVGFLKDIVAVVAYSEPRENTIRIISLRKANKHERQRFEKALNNALGKG